MQGNTTTTSVLSANALCPSKAKPVLNEIYKTEPSCSLRLSKHALGMNALDFMPAFCRAALWILDNAKKLCTLCTAQKRMRFPKRKNSY